ncbi:MAG: hypothetical protein ACYSR0_02490 [Planctomycetota bacterium]|jgi:hypothetical protein
MAKKVSNKEKIQQKAEATAAVTKEKPVKKVRKTTPRKKATAATTRRKIVWKVFNDSFKEVDCFPYHKQAQAYSTAADLTQKKNRKYFVNEVSVPMEET